jgi:hypothetical protein
MTALASGAVAALASVLLPALPAGAAGTPHVFARGAAPDHGGPAETPDPVTAVAGSADGGGYWVLTADGGIRSYGDAVFLGSAAGDIADRRAVDLAAHPSQPGYWLVTDDGHVRAFGAARDFGSAPGAPIVGMAATASGNGYWLVASDGAVSAFGDATFFGSTPRPTAGLAAAPGGRGYWVAGADGSVAAFGSAVAAGGLLSPSAPVVSIASSPLPGGYWLLTADGRVHAFGSARDFGSPEVAAPAEDVAGRPLGDGYWVVTGAAPEVRAESAVQAVPYQPAPSGEPSDADFDRLAQCESGGRWNLNSGNGYYGGLQFSAGTWRSHGGTGLPSDHSRAEQIAVGRTQWRESGWRAWPSCSRQLGLR